MRDSISVNYPMHPLTASPQKENYCFSFGGWGGSLHCDNGGKQARLSFHGTSMLVGDKLEINLITIANGDIDEEK